MFSFVSYCKKIILYIIFQFSFVFPFCASIGLNLDNVELPEGNWIVLANGSWNNWSWGQELNYDNGFFTGNVCELSNGEYQYVYAITGDFDNWSGWGMVGNAPLGSSCDYNPNDQWQNYGFNIYNSNINLEYNNWGECGSEEFVDNDILLKPRHGQELNYIHVPFSWKQLPDAVGYNFEISQSEIFVNSILMYTDINSIFIKDNIEWNSSYFWRIQPVYLDSVIGIWSNPNVFYTSDIEFNLSAEIYDGIDSSYNYTIFSDWNGVRTSIVDLDGREIWNSGSFGFMLNDISEYGQMFGFSYLDYPNNTGIEINYDKEVIWNAPDVIDPHAFIQISNDNYMGFTPSSDNFGPIPLGPWTSDYQNIGYLADGMTSEIVYKAQSLTEFDKETKEVVWSWDPFDYYTMSHSDLYGGTWWYSWMDGFHDWTHSNAFFYDNTNNAVYISNRHLSRITKIDYLTKDVVWNMGLDSSYGTGNNICSDLEFSFQHHIQSLDDGTLLFFDNGNLDMNIFNDEYNSSRVLRVKVINNSYCEIIWEYSLAPEYYGAGMGSVQLLDNGNYFINTTGNSGTLLEVTSDQNLVWKLTLGLFWPNGSGYRSFRLKDIHPGIFSVIAENYKSISIDDSIINTIVIDNQHETINFKLSNLSNTLQPYVFILNNTSGNVVRFVQDTLLIDALSSVEVTFPANFINNSISEINFIIYPQYHQYLEKSLIFKVLKNYFGDINDDGSVNILDVVILSNYILNDTFIEDGDINNDNFLNILDLIEIINFIIYE